MRFPFSSETPPPSPVSPSLIFPSSSTLRDDDSVATGTDSTLDHVLGFLLTATDQELQDNASTLTETARRIPLADLEAALGMDPDTEETNMHDVELGHDNDNTSTSEDSYDVVVQKPYSNSRNTSTTPFVPHYHIWLGAVWIVLLAVASCWATAQAGFSIDFVHTPKTFVGLFRALVCSETSTAVSLPWYSPPWASAPTECLYVRMNSSVLPLADILWQVGQICFVFGASGGGLLTILMTGRTLYRAGRSESAAKEHFGRAVIIPCVLLSLFSVAQSVAWLVYDSGVCQKEGCQWGTGSLWNVVAVGLRVCMCHAIWCWHRLLMREALEREENDLAEETESEGDDDERKVTV